MTAIHFQANFLPKIKKFKIELQIDKERWVELMTIARFLRFAKSESPLKIGGLKVTFQEDDGKCFKAVRTYFKNVADSYIESRYKK